MMDKFDRQEVESFNSGEWAELSREIDEALASPPDRDLEYEAWLDSLPDETLEGLTLLRDELEGTKRSIEFLRDLAAETTDHAARQDWERQIYQQCIKEDQIEMAREYAARDGSAVESVNRAMQGDD